MLYRKLLFRMTLRKRKNRRRIAGAVKVGGVVGVVLYQHDPLGVPLAAVMV